MKKGLSFIAASFLAASLFASMVMAYPSGNTVWRKWGDYITLPSDTAQNFSTNKFTYAFWIYLSTLDDWGGMINKGGSGDVFDPQAKTVCIDLQLGSPFTDPNTMAKPVYWISVVAGWDTVNKPIHALQIPPRSWHHVLFTYDGDTSATYVDSKLDFKFKSGGPLTHGCDGLATNFGADFPGTVEFTRGAFDEIMIWNKAVSMNDTAAIRKGDLTNLQDGLVGYYKFDESQGDTAYDASSRKNHGLLKSTNINPTWKRITAGYPTLDTTKIVYDPNPTRVSQSISSVHSNSMFKITAVSSKAISVAYSLSSGAKVRAELLDLSGKTIAILGYSSAYQGKNAVSYSLPAHLQGTYICKVSSGNFSAQQKVSIIK